MDLNIVRTRTYKHREIEIESPVMYSMELRRNYLFKRSFAFGLSFVISIYLIGMIVLIDIENAKHVSSTSQKKYMYAQTSFLFIKNQTFFSEQSVFDLWNNLLDNTQTITTIMINILTICQL